VDVLKLINDGIPVLVFLFLTFNFRFNTFLIVVRQWWQVEKEKHEATDLGNGLDRYHAFWGFCLCNPP
jgi:hypothetical protein